MPPLFEYGGDRKTITQLSRDVAEYIASDETLRSMAIEHTGRKPFILADANVFIGVSRFLAYDDEDGNIQNENMDGVVISVVAMGFGSDAKDEDGDTYGLQIQIAVRDTRSLVEIGDIFISKERRFVDECLVQIGKHLAQSRELCKLNIGNYGEIDITPSGEMNTTLGAIILKLTTGERTL